MKLRLAKLDRTYYAVHLTAAGKVTIWLLAGHQLPAVTTGRYCRGSHLKHAMQGIRAK